MDISLDLTKGSTTYKDLLLVNGDLVMTNDSNPNGSNPVLQNVIQRLSFFYQEWFLDNTQGIPYYQQIFVKNPDVAKIDAIFTNVILSTPGITTLLEYSSRLDSTNRAFFVKFRCQSTSGIINWNGNFPIVGGTT